MFSVETNKAKRLLVISAAGHVSKEEVKHAAEQVREALRDAAPGSRVLTDFRWLESMRPSAAPHIAEIMDALAEKQVASVIRIIPDPGKDIDGGDTGGCAGPVIRVERDRKELEAQIAR